MISTFNFKLMKTNCKLVNILRLNRDYNNKCEKMQTNLKEKR